MLYCVSYDTIFDDSAVSLQVEMYGVFKLFSKQGQAKIGDSLLLARLRLQLLAFLKSDWSDAWLLLLIVTRTVNSIEPASYSRNLVHIT